jgi:hypothetical protein
MAAESVFVIVRIDGGIENSRMMGRWRVFPSGSSCDFTGMSRVRCDQYCSHMPFVVQIRKILKKDPLV